MNLPPIVTHLPPLVNRFPLYPTFPPIEAFRDAADYRKPETCWINCAGCQHRVGFQSYLERRGFIASSGWVKYAAQDVIFCPVCANPKTSSLRVA